MAIQVGINGFGRIGRIALRSMIERGSHSYRIAGINLRNADLDQIIRSSEGNIRNWTSKRVRRLIAEGNAPQFAPDFERINAGQMRTLAGQARAFCFFPSGSIDRAGEVTAQLIQVDSGRPKCVCKEPISLDKRRAK